MSDRRRSDFADFVVSHRGALRRFAYVLCGDWHLADDVVQTALSKLYRAWPHVHAQASEVAYARRVVTRCAVDESRRGWRRERPTDLVVEALNVETSSALGVDHDVGVDLMRALATLPPEQRKVVVLRHWMGMSVEETADTLQIAQGTVKSQSAKALAKLRPLLDDPERSPR